jgi:WD40 repeat protein
MRRVNCLAPGLNPHKPSLFVGFPTMFDRYNLIEGRTESSAVVHENDWVYSIRPIADDRILTVLGGAVEMWTQTKRAWERSDIIVREGRRQKLPGSGKPKYQRPFISSLTPLKSSPQDMAVTLFDGSVKIYDVAQKTMKNSWQEHKGRVWLAEAITEKLLASCGEDATVKLYDVGQKRSICTLGGHAGSVTSICSLTQHLLLTGSCAEDKSQGAEIRCCDMRMLGR